MAKFLQWGGSPSGSVTQGVYKKTIQSIKSLTKVETHHEKIRLTSNENKIECFHLKDSDILMVFVRNPSKKVQKSLLIAM